MIPLGQYELKFTGISILYIHVSASDTSFIESLVLFVKGIAPEIEGNKTVQRSGTPVNNAAFLMHIYSTGSDTIGYLWYRNDTAIAGATGDTLIFDTLALSDTGAYYCIVINDGLSICSLLVTVTINADNDAPVVDSVSLISIVEDNSAGVIFDIYATDPEGRSLTWVKVNNPSKGTLSEISEEITVIGYEGRYTPMPDSCGSDSFSFRVSDSITNSSVFTVPVIIDSINDLPEISINSPLPGDSVDFGTPVPITIIMHDVEGISNLKIYIDSTLTLDSSTGDTSITFDWTAEFAPHVIGEHIIEAIVTDNNSAEEKTQVTVNINGTYISDSLSVQAIIGFKFY